MRRPIATLLAAALLVPAATAAANDPRRGDQWNLDLVGADAARADATGSGAVVAVIDTGVAPDHPDLAGQLAGGRDFVDKDMDARDENGHGTHVAGIVAAATGNGVGVAGVAPGARVLAVRVLDRDGAGTISDVARGIEWAVDQRADVINLSLSPDVPGGGDDSLTRALARAVDAGVVVVAAAGNNGLPFCENETAQGRILCVGAVDRRGARSFFSSFGEGLGLMAPGGSTPFGVPGEDVLSTYTQPQYEWIAGTSQAAPHVAGVAALLASRGVRGQDAVRRILATARDAGVPGPDAEYGAGIVDARAAVAGLPPGGGNGGGGSGASVSVPRSQRISTVLRRGVLVRCRAAGAGRCSASVSYRGRRIASGSAALEAGRTRSFRARTTRHGRRLLRSRTRVRARVLVRLPGSSPIRRTVVLRR